VDVGGAHDAFNLDHSLPQNCYLKRKIDGLDSLADGLCLAPNGLTNQFPGGLPRSGVILQGAGLTCRDA
jgi:hypothetical protein